MKRLALGLALIALPPVTAAPQVPQHGKQEVEAQPAPTWVFENVAAKKLRAKVMRVQPGLKAFSSLVELRVSNPTPYWAEPLEFRMPKKGVPRGEQPPILPRVAPPYATRAGRAIPPKSELRYWVNVPFEKRAVRKGGWAVTHASFFSMEPGSRAEIEQDIAPIEVGRVTQAPGERDLQGNTVPFSRIELHNRDDHPVDVILRAEFRAPKSGEALIQRRLEPGERRTWTVEGPCVRTPDRLDLRGSHIENVELVDWSRLTMDTQAEALADLQAAWDARAIWPNPDLKYQARYRAVIERWDFQRRQKVKVVEEGLAKCRGSFVDFEPDGKGSKSKPSTPMNSEVPEGWTLLGRANQWLAREPFPDWLKSGRVLLHDKTKEETILSVQRTQGQSHYQQFFWLVDGGWVGQTSSPWAHNALPKWWTLESSPHGDLPTQETDWPNRTERPEFFTEIRYEHKTVQGVPLPLRVERFQSVMPAEQSTRVIVELSRHELDKTTLAPKDPAEEDPKH